MPFAYCLGGFLIFWISSDLFGNIGEFKEAGVSKMRTMVERNTILQMLFFRSEGMMAGPYIQLERVLD